MANDRIYLRCKTCEAQKLLYKYYPQREGYANDADVLTAWMNEHLHERAYAMNLAGDPGFVLVTESDDGY